MSSAILSVEGAESLREVEQWVLGGVYLSLCHSCKKKIPIGDLELLISDRSVGGNRAQR